MVVEILRVCSIYFDFCWRVLFVLVKVCNSKVGEEVYLIAIFFILMINLHIFVFTGVRVIC